MEFGQVPVQELDSIDFSLVQEPAANQKILQKNGRAPRLYLGCAKWGRKEWIGKIYPKGTKDAQFLDQYLHHYNAVELNATHYKIYKPEEIARWAAKAAGKDFKFCPKVVNSISHHSGFNNAGDLTAEFLQSILAFGENLGPIFLQVSDAFSPHQREALYAYLRSLPANLQFFLELRHPDWFADKRIHKELFEMLQQLNIGAVITDTAGRRDVAHMELSIPKTFIRFVGNNLHTTDQRRCDAWVNRIKYWLENGLQELYFFMHMHNEAYSPELTVYLAERLNEIGGVHLQKPAIIQGSLF